MIWSWRVLKCSSDFYSYFSLFYFRSLFNPLIVPWWRHAPRRVREMLHQAVVGEPLPPNDLENLPPTCPRCPRSEWFKKSVENCWFHLSVALSGTRMSKLTKNAKQIFRANVTNSFQSAHFLTPIFGRFLQFSQNVYIIQRLTITHFKALTISLKKILWIFVS